MDDATAVLSIGDELIAGEAIDTNSAWISARLLECGRRVVVHRTVGDDEREISGAIAALAERAAVVVVTGGLGPTPDDLTREGLALAMGEGLIEDAVSAEQIEGWFLAQGRELLAINLVQALRPVSSEALENKYGTAPGIVGRVGEALVFLLPGPPREMKPMFVTHVAPRISQGREAWVTSSLHTFGLGESEVARQLGKILARTDGPQVGLTASSGVVTVRLRAPESQRAELETIEGRVREILGGVIFGQDEQTLPRVVVDDLRRASETVAVAESCTGGMLGSMFTGVAGASDVFLGGWLVYHNSLKQEFLGVFESTLAAHGAVSAEVACEMAAGAVKRSGAGWALSITGIAGPSGGSAEKPVGTVWVGCSRADGETTARLFRFPGERETVRTRAAMAALGVLRLAVLKRSDEMLLWERRGES